MHSHTLINVETISTIGTLVFEKDVVFSLMKSMPFNYWTFIISMRKQPNITLQYIITNLLQEYI